MFWQTNTCYEFGPFRVDARERRLLRDGEVVPLRPKVFDILLLLASQGTRAEAMKIVQELESEHPATSYLMAHVYAALGENERAFGYLERALEERHIQLVSLRTDPALDRLRADPRFADVLRRVGLSG